MGSEMCIRDRLTIAERIRARQPLEHCRLSSQPSSERRFTSTPRTRASSVRRRRGRAVFSREQLPAVPDVRRRRHTSVTLPELRSPTVQPTHYRRPRVRRHERRLVTSSIDRTASTRQLTARSREPASRPTRPPRVPETSSLLRCSAAPLAAFGDIYCLCASFSVVPFF